jgi:hypothetical protein
MQKMNKRYYITLLFLIVYATIQAQAIHDAASLRAMLDKEKGKLNPEDKKELLYKILAQNLAEEKENLTYQEIVEAYKENPFIYPYLEYDLGGGDIYEGASGQRALGGLGAAASGLGLPSSSFLMGLTDFLVTRTKQELTIAFFQDFQKKVEESEELQYLFPSTSGVLLEIGKDIYQFNAFWEVLRGSFLADLDNLVYQLDDYVQNSSRIKDEKIKYMMSDYFKTVEMFHDQAAPADIIKYLAEDAYLHTLPAEDSLDQDYKIIPALQTNLKLLGLFSRSLEHEDRNGYWVDPQRVINLLRDSALADFYLGFIYQQGKDLKIGKDKTLGSYLLEVNSKQKSIRPLINDLKRFLEKAKTVARLAKDMRERKNERRRAKAAGLEPAEAELEYKDYFDFTENVTTMLGFAYEFKKELLGSTTQQDSIAALYLEIVSDLNKMGLNIRQKHYTSALINTLFIIEKLLPEEGFSCERQSLMKYGTFIATAVNAKTSKEVSNAIAAFALPPGGSAIKKYSNFSIAVNAYVGVAAGQETLNGFGTKSYYALATPVGVSFNWGLKKAGSIGILASAIDIGALTAFRFQDDNANELPDLKIENVFAPGGYLVYGVPKYPLSIGFGAQLGPNLRSVTDNAGLVTTTNGWRMGAFIAVDIPIVSLYTSNKYYKKCCKNCNK